MRAVTSRLRYQAATELKTDLKRLKRDRDSGSSLVSGRRESGAAESPAKPKTASQKSVAVLYFGNLSGAKDDEFFRDGMTEDVITELTKIEDLKVFPRPAVMVYRDRPVTAPEVVRELSASYVVSGSLRRDHRPPARSAQRGRSGPCRPISRGAWSRDRQSRRMRAVAPHPSDRLATGRNKVTRSVSEDMRQLPVPRSRFGLVWVSPFLPVAFA